MKTIKIKMIKTHAVMNNKNCIGNKIGCEHILTGYIKEGGGGGGVGVLYTLLWICHYEIFWHSVECNCAVSHQ